jgi:ATP-dependent Clp protease protease subunit
LKKFWTFKAKNETTGELMLYGDISSTTWWGDEVTPKQFKEDLDALREIKTLNIYINSGGGDVFAGQAIRSMLKRHSAYKIAYVDGLAASIASVILTACDKVIMPVNAMQMIHKCWTIAQGNADDMRKIAEDMDKIDESIVTAYEEKTGLSKDKIIELMTAETWMTAEEAVEYGFADEIEEEKAIAASLDGGFLIVNGQQMDLSRFKTIPDCFKNLKRQKPDPSVLIQNTGRALSTANEQKLVNARDLIDSVLEQANEEGKKDSKPPEDKQTNETGLLSLLQARTQTNRNRIGGNF